MLAGSRLNAKASLQLATPLTPGDFPDSGFDVSFDTSTPYAEENDTTSPDVTDDEKDWDTDANADDNEMALPVPKATEEVPNGGYGAMPPAVPIAAASETTTKKKKKKSKTEDKAAKSSEGMAAKLKQVLSGHAVEGEASFEGAASAEAEETWRRLVIESWQEVKKVEAGERQKAGESASASASVDIEEQKLNQQQKQTKSGWSFWGKKNAVDNKGLHEDEHDSNKKNNGMGNSQFVIPQTFEEMCALNAGMIGINLDYVKIVQDCFDRLIAAVAKNEDYQLQVEANVMSLRMHKDVKGNFKPGDFKMCMLSSLRSLLPKSWSIAHENAWTTFWDKVAKMLSDCVLMPAKYEKAVERLMQDMQDDEHSSFGVNAFNRLFDAHPGAENYFKSSNSRLNTLAFKGLELSAMMYKEPTRVVNEVASLGIRHIMYMVSVEYFEPLVNAYVEELRNHTTDVQAVEGIQYTLTLIATIMVTTLNEGSTPILSAVASNSPKEVRKALAMQPRGKRSDACLGL